jgi:hypothetical protein
MSFFRWDVLLLGFVLALPVLLLGMRGDLSVAVMTGRLPWCLVAAWVVVSLLRWATTPPAPPEGEQEPRGMALGGPLDGMGAEHETHAGH